MGKRFTLPASPALLVLLALLPACSSRAGTDSPVIQITELSPGVPVVDVVGLSPRDLDAMSRVAADEWPSIFRIRVVGGPNDVGLPSVSGGYTVTGDRVRFTPDFPFDGRVAYEALFERPGATSLALSIPRTVKLQDPSTRVTGVFPPDTLFENHLRLYIHFSAAMSNRGADTSIRLLDEHGREVEDPFLPIDVHLWNEDWTRYTLLFDPGRVKRGILPNMEKGRALERGGTYTLVVDREWRDAAGRPLVETFKREFRVVAEVVEPIVPAEWRLAVPRPATREPLAATFPRPLDHALAQRMLVVTTAGGRGLDGAVAVDPSTTRWTFTPSEPWSAGEYRLRALSELEDPAGNRIGRAFDYDAARGGEEIADRHAEASLPFVVK